MSDTQQHQLADGSKVQISRNGRHQYWIGDDGPKMKSVTSMLKHIEGDTFGIGMNWTRKEINEAIFPELVGQSFQKTRTKSVKEQRLDFVVNSRGAGPMEITPETLLRHTNAADDASSQSTEMGNRLHDAIDQYIRNHVVNEEDPLFLAWFNEVGGANYWLASELFVYNPALEPHYGGTVDAISIGKQDEVVIWDWKTKERESYEKYGGYLHEQAQLAAYTDALRAMGSAYLPTKGCIAYIMRDGSYVDVVEVDLERGSKLFNASRELFLLTQGGE
jgi:hypothetical protein